MAAYPHKQTVVILILCILAVGGAALYVHRSRLALAGNAPAQDRVTVTTARAEPLPETDWQKQFLALASSTGSFTAGKNTAPAAPVNDNTATYKFGQEFLTQYIALRQTGLASDARTVSSTIDQIIARGASAIDQPTIYGSGQLSIVTDSPDVIRAYATVFQSALKEYSVLPDEADIAARAFETGDPSQLSALDPIIISLRSMVNRLLAVRVPRSFADNHLDLVNSLSILLYSATAFRHMDTDPLKGLAAIRFDAIVSQSAITLFSKIAASLPQTSR